MKRMTEDEHGGMMFAIGLALAASIVIGAIMQAGDGSWYGFMVDAAKLFALFASCIVGWTLVYVYTKPEAPDETK